MDRDLDHLRLLSIFHYVTGGLSVCFSMMFLFHVGFGGLMLGGAIEGGDDEVRVVGGFLMVIGLALITVGVTYSVCVILAGRALANQRSYTFCMVIAALQCLNAPLGTVLGVFTILVLMRPSVRELFESKAAG